MSFKLLHTADWHLGRTFNQIHLLADQSAVLDQIFGHVVEHRPDALIIAGDIFDRANPRREAIELFDRFLARVYRETETALVVIAGNHDAPERIGYGGALHDPRRVLIRGPLSRGAGPLVLRDAAGPVAISALPFAGVFAARDHFGEPAIATPADVLRQQIEEARRAVPDGARWVVTAHAFVQGGKGSESERPLDLVGGIETVPAELFGGADYVALGHLHRAQAVAEHIRYPGSIMRYGFDEVDCDKSVGLVELAADGAVSCRALPIAPPRTLRIVRGGFDRILRDGPQGNPDDFVKIELDDTRPIHNAMSRLREVYPNAAQLAWVGRESVEPRTPAASPASRHHQPLALFASFHEAVTGEPLAAESRAVVAEAIAALNDGDD